MDFIQLNNGFALKGLGTPVLDADTGYLQSVTGRKYRVKHDGELLTPAIHETLAVYVGGFNVDNVDIKEVKLRPVVETYTSDEEGFKDIDVETYQKLSDNFKKKYRSVSSGLKEVHGDVKLNVTTLDADFDTDVYAGEKVSELQKLLHGQDYQPTPSLSNLKKVTMSRTVVLEALKALYEQDEGDLSQVKATFKADFVSGFSSKKGLEGLEVEYFTVPYKGEMKKKYQVKANGRKYADGRHTLVPDYPDVASTVIVREEDVAGFVIGDDDDANLDSIKVLYDALFHPAV